MVAFIDDYRDVYGVEAICRVLTIAPSTYRAIKTQQADPARQSAHAKRDAALREAIRPIWADNFRVYGARKVWHALLREGSSVARCTAETVIGLFKTEVTRQSGP